MVESTATGDDAVPFAFSAPPIADDMRNYDLGEPPSPQNGLPADDEGEVLLRGPHMVQDPEPEPEATAAAPSQAETPLAAPETSEGSPPPTLSPPSATLFADAEAPAASL